MRPHWQYLKYILRHKWFVFVAAYQMGIPWLGIIHDWSKFTPGEWFPYVKRFYGAGNSFDEAMQDIAYQYAWNHHQKHNKHHWEYWRLVRSNGETTPLPMPDRYRREMLADWVGMGQTLGKPKIWEWYEENREIIQLHPDTREQVELFMIVFRCTGRITFKITPVGDN